MCAHGGRVRPLRAAGAGGRQGPFSRTLFAPQKYRRALHALYAFNLEVARTRELAREPMPGEIRLQWWRDALGGPAGEATAHPVAAALRDVVVRYRLPPRDAGRADRCAHVRSLRRADGEPADLEGYAAQTSSALIELAARILARRPRSGRRRSRAARRHRLRHRRAAARAAGPCRARPALSAGRSDAAPWRASRPTCSPAGRPPSCARRWRNCGCAARQHLAAARGLLALRRQRSLPALLPVALVRPALDRMERRSYQPFSPRELPQWRRQWALWRAARSGLRTAF